MKALNPAKRKFGNNQGFTLIEMAIVLVIIGVIIGAVVKGQDLVENAKAKQFASKLQAWQIAINTFYDRKGRYPGDSDRDGIIASSDTLTPLDDINSASFSSPPETSFSIGGVTFYAKLGNGNGKNYLAVCKDDTCNGTYTPTNSSDATALKFFESFDTSIDGKADAINGTILGLTGASATAQQAKITGVTTSASNADWLNSSNTLKGLAYQIK
ncbi:type II secretion system protein [Geobacter sp. SVR]|uniref:type II secretion system protein n=1 Tax=Geobacter sp. SVR TaxID=2495594 RepID=UPI00143EF94B|nr:prepilin-type N-terminal cleavage/methylation domain-containing protein [Geobacter sp. SVR]BCS54719.1 prepilin-type N-terminal cleavage/methylation domain-containing protein [Geobacter sp. SVR]GCF86473.1 prepilin-type N-terminal cleavage/methylation domain-containing protein [Geobacter sp. SVR]